VALLLFLGSVCEGTSTLYGLFGPPLVNPHLAHLAAIDTNTGKFSDVFTMNVSNNILGAAETFNQSGQLYYFASFFPKAVVYSADINNHQLLSPIVLDVSGIMALNFDPSTQNLLVVTADRNKRTMSVFYGKQGNFKRLPLSGKYDAQSLVAGAVDPQKSCYYIVGNSTFQQQYHMTITTIDLPSFQIISEVATSLTMFKTQTPWFVMYRPVTQTIVVLQNGPSTYSEIDPETGAGESIQLPFSVPEYTYVLAAAYDEQKDILWLVTETESNQLQQYDPKTNKLSSPVSITTAPLSIHVSQF